MIALRKLLHYTIYYYTDNLLRTRSHGTYAYQSNTILYFIILYSIILYMIIYVSARWKDLQVKISGYNLAMSLFAVTSFNNRIGWTMGGAGEFVHHGKCIQCCAQIIAVYYLLFTHTYIIVSSIISSFTAVGKAKCLPTLLQTIHNVKII